MKLTCFFVQRTCRNPGQYALELFDAADEVVVDENPDYVLTIKEKMVKMLEDKEIEFWREIVVEIDDDQFEKAFNPSVPAIAGSIVPDHHQAHLEDPCE